MINEIVRLIKKYGNDYELGSKVRELFYKRRNGKQCKTNNRRTEHDSDSV